MFWQLEQKNTPILLTVEPRYFEISRRNFEIILSISKFQFKKHACELAR